MISVVIICRNEERLIKQCIKSIQGDLFSEIIVVDGNSSDNTREIVNLMKVEDSRIRLIEINHTQITAALGRQKGIENLSRNCKYVLFLDGDMELNPLFVTRAMSILSVSEIAGISGQRADYIYNDNFELIRKKEDFYDINKAMFLGGAFMVKAEPLFKYGEFDIHYPILEETFFYDRFKKNNEIFIRIPDPMIIHHMYSPTSKKHFFKRLFDKKLQAYGIILFHLKRNQLKIFLSRINTELKVFVLLITILASLALSLNPIILFFFLIFSMYFMNITVKSLIRITLFIIFIPIGFLGEFFRK